MTAEAYDLSGKKVWVAGHRGMVGSALVRRLEREDCEVLTVGRDVVDLCDPAATLSWMKRTKPHAVFLAAARVGGILDNSERPADFLRDNLMIASSVIPAAADIGVEKLLFLGSSCIYPKEAPQPLTEDALLTGPLEPTNEPYAVAKIAGLKLAEGYRRQFGHDFISAMPTNLYGPGDNFDLRTSHVLPALIAKALIARDQGSPNLEIWGSGRARREFLHVDDCADALVHVMMRYSAPEPINVGTGEDIPILELAHLVMRIVGLDGKVLNDESLPEGTLVKRLDVSRINRLGWHAKITLEDGIRSTLAWIEENPSALRRLESGAA